MEDPDTLLSRLVAIPTFVTACIFAFQPESGLKILRLVRKDVKDLLMQSISRFSLRCELESSCQPAGLVDAICFLRKAPRVSSLRVTISVTETNDDEYEEQLEEEDLTRIILQPLQRFVGEMGPSLLNITSLEVQMEVLDTPPPCDDREPMPDNLARKLMPIKFVAERVLSLLALACPKIHTLHVVCPEVLYTIPFQLLKHVRSFAIGTYMYRYTEYRTVEFTSCHLKSFLARLTSLTLLPSSSGHPLLNLKHLRDCRSLTFLDCGNHRSGAMWALLPPCLRELHCRFSHPGRGNHIPPAGAYAALPPALRSYMLAQMGHTEEEEEEYTEPAKLTQLARWVITDWQSNFTDFSRREQLVLDEFVHVLELAPNMRDVVLQRRHPYERELASVIVSASTSASQPALARLHKRLVSGLRLTTEYWPKKLKFGGPPPSPQGFQLQLTVFREERCYDSCDEEEYDEDEEDGSQISLKEYFSGMRQPCPAFTDILIKSGAQANLKGLHVAFPNVCKLAVTMIEKPRQLAHLVMCRSLHALEIHEHSYVSAREMASAISQMKSLKSLTVGTRYGYQNFDASDKALLKQLLSTSNPGLLVTMN